MWPRHRPDIGARDLAYAAAWLVGGGDAPRLDAEIVRGWFSADEAIVCLSVRSGFDLTLSAAGLPRGSEVLFSGVNIEGMARIAERHGLVPAGVPIDHQTTAPTPEAVDRRVTDRTSAIVVANLFGRRASLAGLAGIAREHRLLLIEDNAQAFAGKTYAGSPEADVSLFSFGLIKPATAGGGAVLRVRDANLHRAMTQRLAGYPLQTRPDYARRLLRLAVMASLSRRPAYSVLYALLNRWGSPDRSLAMIARTSPAELADDRLRRRPCVALRRLLRRQVQNTERQQRRIEFSQTIAAEASRLLGPARGDPGPRDADGQQEGARWVLPVVVADPVGAADELRRHGFDVTRRSSLRWIGFGKEAPPPWLDHTIFLPVDPAMPGAQRKRMIAVASKWAGDKRPPGR